MITISVKHNFDDVIRRLKADLPKQVEFAKTLTLTRLAAQAAKDTQAELPRVLDRPTPFTVKSVRWTKATKANQASTVYIAPIAAAYLEPLISGRTVRPKRRALLEPAAVALNQYGNLPRRKLKQLLARKDTFSGEIRGIGGIWQRTARGPKLLVKFEQQATKRKQIPFASIVRKSVQRNASAFFERAWRQAQATAR